MENYRLGILFVHGIGEQPKADALMNAAEPLVRWIRQALDPAVVQFTDARFSLTGAVHDEPAHAVVSIEPASEPAQKWLLADGWWGGEIRRPPFFRLAGWMLTTGAWMIVSHFLRAEHGKTNWLAALRRVARLVLFALPLVLIGQAAVLVLSGLAVLPLPQLRAVLSRALLALTGILGDTFVFVENRTQQAAIVAETRRRIEWLAQRCERVAVLAHSQGAAVAHRALRTARLRNAELFITYGAAITKIEEVEFISERSPDEFRAAYLAIPLSALSAAAMLRVWFYYPNDEGAWIGMLWALVSFLSLFLVFDSARRYRDVLEKRVRRLALGLPPLLWYDVFATADAVSNGPLGAIPGLRSRRVVNTRSWLTDHTTYWRNTSQFVPLVGRRILKAAGLTALLEDAPSVMARRISREHVARVAWLVHARWATLLACILAPFVLRDALPAIGDSALRVLKHAPVDGAEWLSILSALGPPQLVLGSAIPIALIVAWYAMYAAIWRSWDGRAADRSFKNNPPDRYVVQAVYTALGFLPLALVVLRWWRPELFVAAGIESRLYRLLGWAFVSLATLILAAAVVRQALVIGRQMMWKEIAGLVYLVAFLVVFVVLVAPGVASEAAQRNVSVAFGMALLAAKMVNVHLGKVNETGTAVVRAVALAAPFALAVAAAVFDPRPNEPAMDRMVTAVGAYMCGVGLVALMAKVGNWRVESHRG